MEAKLAELIRNNGTPSGGGSGAVSGVPYVNLHGSKVRFSIIPAKLGDFLDGYCALAKQDETLEADVESSKLGLSIGEVPMTKTLPLMLTMLFRFHLNDEMKEDPLLYNDDFILSIVNLIQQAMADKLQISQQMSELICCVLESKPWHKGEDTYVRIRFQFPYAQVDAMYQSRTLRPLMIKLLRAARIISRLEVSPVGDWDVILEEIKDVVGLYRSKEDINQSPMTFTHIYGYVPETEIESKNMPELELKDIFSPANHSFVFRQYTSNQFLQKNEQISYWLPLFLSVNYWGGMLNPKDSGAKNDGPKPSSSDDGSEQVDDKDPLYIVRQLLPLLNINRFNVEPYWMDIGRVLFNITDGGDEGLELWIQYSAKAEAADRDKDACIARYGLPLKGTFLSEKTVAWYAKEDSPQAYKEWHMNWCNNSLSQAMSLNQVEVAEAIYRVFWLDYICTKMSTSKDGWMRFTGNQLKKMDDAIYLRKAITDILIPIYKRMRLQCSEQSLRADSKESDKKHLESQISQINKLINKLNNQGFRSAIINLARENFYVEDFDRIKDSDPTKTGWSNCVIECCGDRAYDRSGKPEDYITMTTYIPYRGDFTWDHPLIKELMIWLGQVFVDDELKRYFLKDASCMLLGRNAEKYFRVWTGDTNGSKSMIVKLFQATLGMYCCDFPVTMLCGKTMASQSGPTPELAQARGAHVGIIAEPSHDEPLHGAKVKRHTGGDRFFARMCNENGGSIEAFYKLILMCNRIPPIPDLDDAVEARVFILPFLSSWVDDAPMDEAERYKQRKFKKDPFFEKRIPELALAFAWVMVQYFTFYKNEGLRPPEIVKTCIKNHWQENDPYLNFIRDRVGYAYVNGDDKNIDKNASVIATDLYVSFKKWYGSEYPGGKVPDQPRFTAEMKMKSRLGPQDGRRWRGIRVNEPVLELPRDHR